MGIFSSMFRHSVGMPMKSEILGSHIDVYKKIIDGKNEMEKSAFHDLSDNSEFSLINAKIENVVVRFRNGIISSEEFVCESNTLNEIRDNFFANYIDSQNDNTFYGVIRNGLKSLKNRNLRLLNIDKMEFDFWRQIVASSELAKLTILQVTSSSDYQDALKSDEVVKKYYVNRNFR